MQPTVNSEMNLHFCWSCSIVSINFYLNITTILDLVLHKAVPPATQSLDGVVMAYWQGPRCTYFLGQESSYVNANAYWTPLPILTPCSRVLLEKLTGSQLAKKFPTFYGTWKFFTVFTSARHLSLSWASSIQSTPAHPTSWRSILILSSPLCLGLASGFFPSGFSTKTLCTPPLYPKRATRPAHLIFSILSLLHSFKRCIFLYHSCTR